MSSKKWVVAVLGIICLFLAVMAVITYVIDPLNYYRWNDLRFINSGSYFMPGIVKHYDADAYIVGSSMIQHTDMDEMRALGYQNPVKLEKSGMTFNEALMVLGLVDDNDKEMPTFLNLDLVTLLASNEVTASSTVFPEYLFNDSPFDDFEYLWGYETWYRYIPVTLGLFVIDGLFDELPSLLSFVTEVDNIGTGYNDNQREFGLEVVRSKYLSGTGGTTTFDHLDLEEQYAKVDSFVELLGDRLEDFPILVVGFPPYSALFWYVQNKNGVMDEMLAIKQYLIQRLMEFDNVRIVDLQSIDQIADLEHYIDQSHFDSTLQSLYTEVLCAGDGNVHSVEDIEASNKRISALVEQFEQNNKSWL